MVRPAHDAVRGRKKTATELRKRALTNAANARMTPLEKKVCAALSKRRLAPVAQLAIGPYNCDLALDPVAVEVWGGGHHGTRDHRARDPIRIRYLLNRGWHVYIIHITGKHQLVPRAADDIVAFVKKARANPTSIREYRMVWGTGEFLAGGRADDDEITLVPAFTARRNPTTGRYETVAR